MSESEISKQVLDQLADGELPQTDYANVLRRMERRPEDWKRCALTFLEHQALRRELSDIVSNRQRFEPADDGEEWEVTAESADAALAANPAARNWWARPVVRWTSVLAVGVLAFVGGIALQTRPVAVQPSVADAPPRIRMGPIVEPQPVSESTGLASIWIDDLDAGDPRRLEVPVRLISANNNDKLAPERLPPQIETLLPRSGNPNQLERRVLMVRTQTGEIILFTVDRVTHGIAYQ